MTKAEARGAYRTSYLYWHGKGRCWDAGPRASHRSKRTHAVKANPVKASHKTKAKLNQEMRVEAAESRPVPKEASGTLTPDDLRTWANSMAAMPSDPIVTILDRWPDEELPQSGSKPAAAEEPSLKNARTVMTLLIMFMAVLATLIGVTLHRRSSYRG
jgi:hypothetical protein